MRDESLLEDKLVLSKATDTINLSQKRFSPCYYGFLNEHQAQLIKDRLHFLDDCVFWGGYSEAQRVVFGANTDNTLAFPIVALKFSYKKEFKLTHRDFLGAFMALGVERSTIGDIIVYDGQAIVFVKSEMADFFIREISKVGRVGIGVSTVDIDNLEIVSDFELIDLTVSSLRLDVLVSALCAVSRDKSQKMIKADLVCVNHNVTNNVSATISVTDVITIRKYGKFVFIAENGFSKKGKIRITVKHFR